MSKTSLSVYRIRDEIDGEPVSSFDQILNEDARKAMEARSLVSYGPVQEQGFEACLFAVSPRLGDPEWQDLLRQGFSGLGEFHTLSNSALLGVKVRRRRRDFYFAFAFGFGRNLLAPDAFEPRFGLRVALNLIYQGDQPTRQSGLERLRQVDAKRVEANTLLSRIQANRLATFDTFGLDVQRDLLGAVTGNPADPDRWGTRVSGAASLHLLLDRDFSELGKLCLDLLRAYERKDYRVRFSWIDNIHAVTSAKETAPLERELLKVLTAGSGPRHRLDLAPPELVDWDRITGFRFSFDRKKVRYEELDLNAYLEALRNNRKLATLKITDLHNQRVLAVDDSDEAVYEWPVFRCLDAELRLDRQHYLLAGGDFFRIAAGYLRQLDAEVGLIPRWPRALPPAKRAESEGSYNERVGKGRFLLLDRKTVRIDTRTTTPIEICDLLTGGSLIHVKAKLSSSTLSHLFAQGAVSGDLLLTSREFRREALKQIRLAEKRKRKIRLPPFTRFSANEITPRQLQVVYAIIDHWSERKLKDLVAALPFFSKINLRRHAEDLRSMGYKVFYSAIDVAPGKARKAAGAPAQKWAA